MGEQQRLQAWRLLKSYLSEHTWLERIMVCPGVGAVRMEKASPETVIIKTL